MANTPACPCTTHPRYDVIINYCPLHATAADLLTACEELIGSKSDHDEKCAIVNCPIEKLKAAIKAARGE